MDVLKLIAHENVLLGTLERTEEGSPKKKYISFGITMPEWYGRLRSETSGSYNVGDFEQWLYDLGFSLRAGSREFSAQVTNFQLGMGAEPIDSTLFFTVADGEQHVTGIGLSGLFLS